MANNVGFLNDAGRRPVDELLRRALRRDGACRGVIRDILKCPIDIAIPEKIEWLDGHLQPRQRTWNTDLIGYLDHANIIHIEQQTSNHGDMDIRMLEYGALIASNDKLQRNINQIYYSTDDRPVAGRSNLQRVDNQRRSIGNRYLFVDAGGGNAWAYFDHENFDVALFGFLVRQIDDFTRFADHMVRRALSDYDGQELIDRLVDCVGMGALRRRGRLVQEHIPMHLKESIDDDPYMAEMQNKKQRQSLRTVLDVALEKVDFMPPNGFISWLIQEGDERVISNVVFAMGRADSFEALLATSGVEWPVPENAPEIPASNPGPGW